MDNYDWNQFLTRWNSRLLADPEITRTLEPAVIEAGWLGYPGAGEEQIRQAEARLGTTLPPSYRGFLRASNGWRKAGYFIDRMWPAEDIEWFSTRNQEIIDIDLDVRSYTNKTYGQEEQPVADEDYFVYGEAQKTHLYRPEYLQTALEISDWGDSAIYLLNPQAVTADGEWEAWFLASWLPGARRYRSFREMMQEEHGEAAG